MILLILAVAIPVTFIACLSWPRKKRSPLSRQLALGQLENAMSRAEQDSSNERRAAS